MRPLHPLRAHHAATSGAATSGAATSGAAAAAAGLTLTAALLGCSDSGDRPARTVTVTAPAAAPREATVTIAPWSAGTAAPTTTRPTVRAVPHPPPATRAARPPATSPGPAAGGVRVPSLVGRSLATALATLKDLGVPRDHRSPHDVSGKGRTVLNPDNWRVCTQRPAAGTTASALTVYEFGVVKYGERCP